MSNADHTSSVSDGNDSADADGSADTDDYAPAQNGDADAAYRDESDWGLEDLKPSDEPVERYVTFGGKERRLLVKEATDADAPDIDRESEAEAYRAMAAFFREHIIEPKVFADVTASDLRGMRVGVSPKLLNAIVPEASDQGNLR